MRVFSEPETPGTGIGTTRRCMVLALATAALPGQAWAQPLPVSATGGSLRLVATEFPPYTSATLKNAGTACAITRAALDRVGLSMVLQFRPWARAMVELQQGQWDGVIGAWHSPEREAFMAFPHPLGITNRIGFMARAGLPLDVSDLNRLGGLKIGVVRDYANPPAFDQARLQRDEAFDDLSNLRKLLAGRIDLALIDKGVAFHLMRTQLPESTKALVWLEPALAEVPLYTAHPGATRN